MADFRIELNGQTVDEPKGFRELEEGVTRDESLRVITTNYNGTLDFFGNGYLLLEGLYFSEYCTEVLFEVFKDNIKVISCTINLADAT